jgi:hypothetical protein
MSLLVLMVSGLGVWLRCHEDNLMVSRINRVILLSKISLLSHTTPASVSSHILHEERERKMGEQLIIKYSMLVNTLNSVRAIMQQIVHSVGEEAKSMMGQQFYPTKYLGPASSIQLHFISTSANLQSR